LTIRGHLEIGLEPSIEILDRFETRQEADEAERAFIKYFGRLGRDPDGILCNVARGGNGPDSTLMNDAEVIAHISAASKRYWSNPKHRATQSKKMADVAKGEAWKESVSLATTAAIHKPDARAKHVAALRRISASISSEQKRAWGQNASEETKAKRIAALEKARNDPASKERHATAVSAAMKASWADPEKRAMRKAGLKGVKKTRTDASVAARAYAVQCMNTPEANAKKGVASKGCWADPEFRAKQKASRAAAWADPVKRANVIAGRERARAAKLAASEPVVLPDVTHDR
jgi:hypothetical protein